GVRRLTHGCVFCRPQPQSQRNRSGEPDKVMPAAYNQNPVPADGEAIRVENGKFLIPDQPIVPFIEGDGIGRDIWKASSRVFDAAVEKCYGGKRRIVWYEIFAGEKAF